MKRRNKYGAVPVEADGHRFASKAEHARYCELKVLQKGCVIEALELQPKFPLVVNGHKCGSYIADFAYLDRRTGERVVEDVKSKPTTTPVYRLKKKLVKALCGIDVVEV